MSTNKSRNNYSYKGKISHKNIKGFVFVLVVILFLIFVSNKIHSNKNSEETFEKENINTTITEDTVDDEEYKVMTLSEDSVQYSTKVEMPELTEEEYQAIIEQELIASGYYREDVPLSFDLQDVLHEYCETFSVSYNLVLGLIRHESGFDENAVSSVGCYGLMQLNPKYFPSNLNSSDNLYYGVKYLSECIERYDGDIMAGLRAYNRGYDDGARGYSKTVIKYAEEFNRS